jgi:hypothetical protein
MVRYHLRHLDTAYQPVAFRQRGQRCAVVQARLTATVPARPWLAWCRWRLLLTDTLLVTRLELRALRTSSLLSPRPSTVRDWHARVS